MFLASAGSGRVSQYPSQVMTRLFIQHDGLLTNHGWPAACSLPAKPSAADMLYWAGRAGNIYIPLPPPGGSLWCCYTNCRSYPVSCGAEAANLQGATCTVSLSPRDASLPHTACTDFADVIPRQHTGFQGSPNFICRHYYPNNSNYLKMKMEH